MNGDGFVGQTKKSIEEKCLSESPTSKNDADRAADCFKSNSERIPNVPARGSLNQATYGGIDACREHSGEPQCSPLGAIPGNDWQGRHYMFETAASANLAKYFREKATELRAKGMELEMSANAEREKRAADAKAEQDSAEGIRKAVVPDLHCHRISQKKHRRRTGGWQSQWFRRQGKDAPVRPIHPVLFTSA